ncbi:hypothetical protein [Nocardioides sp. B-3]|uniref:hypothetical protein n=1 Tax=Nocardioides sp. B-3 TaxID=2895565 RepID=UPI00215388F7|nr:hypothetical protein [Nocardioides sp. B-3]UUZ60594.1 hypothetical protein LP418_06975 [Nocardioides sp. B-3]
MTMTPAQIERKVRQLDNDVQSIYDLLGTISASQHNMAATLARRGNRLDELAAALEVHDQRFDGVDQRFDGVDQRFDGVDQRFDGIDAKLEEILTLVRAR